MSLGLQVTPRSIPCLAHSFGHGNISNSAVSFLYHNGKYSKVDNTKYPMKTKAKKNYIKVSQATFLKNR